MKPRFYERSRSSELPESASKERPEETVGETAGFRLFYCYYRGCNLGKTVEFGHETVLCSTEVYRVD